MKGESECEFGLNTNGLEEEEGVLIRNRGDSMIALLPPRDGVENSSALTVSCKLENWKGRAGEAFVGEKRSTLAKNTEGENGVCWTLGEKGRGDCGLLP